jgi:hypothetical protein
MSPLDASAQRKREAAHKAAAEQAMENHEGGTAENVATRPKERPWAGLPPRVQEEKYSCFLTNADHHRKYYLFGRLPANEGMGETGMAHLLHNSVLYAFRRPKTPTELVNHGARPNGTILAG